MFPMIDQGTIIEILTWAVLAFAAGFIGFFGKSLGRRVISLFHKEKESISPHKELNRQVGQSPEPSGTRGREEGAKDLKKREKNRLKLEKKQKKDTLKGSGKEDR